MRWTSCYIIHGEKKPEEAQHPSYQADQQADLVKNISSKTSSWFPPGPAALYQLATRMHSRALPCWTGCRVRDECRSSPHGSQLKLYSKASPLWLAAESILVQAQHGPAFSSAGKIAKVVELYSTSEKQGRKLANRIATWMLSRVKFGLKVSELNVLPSEGKKEKLISRGEFKMATTMFWSKGWDTCHAFR